MTTWEQEAHEAAERLAQRITMAVWEDEDGESFVSLPCTKADAVTLTRAEYDGLTTKAQAYGLLIDAVDASEFVEAMWRGPDNRWHGAVKGYVGESFTVVGNTLGQMLTEVARRIAVVRDRIEAERTANDAEVNAILGRRVA